MVTNFSKAWGGYKESDGSVRDNGPSPEYVDDGIGCMALKATVLDNNSKDYAATARGVAIHGGAHSITCFQGRGNIVGWVKE